MAKKRLFGGLLLTAGSATTALGSFLRNIIIARLISVEDFGIAATFALTVAMIELCSNLAIDRLLVQAQDGEDEKLQATAHSVQVIQGVVGAVILFALAHPIAALFDIPDVVWAFQLLAAVPFIRGLSHLDRSRFQRDLRFGPSVVVDTLPQVAATVVAIPAGIYIGDYSAMLWVIFTQIILFTVLSHLVAKRRYSLAWSGPLVRRAVSFGGPLLLNGFLMFGIFQGDRAIVGAAFGMEEMGWFSAAFAMTLAPSMLIAKVCQSFFLPQLSKLQDEPAEFAVMANVTMQVCLLAGLLIAVGFATAGPPLTLLLYGNRYIDGAAIVGLLGVMQGIRVVRAGATIVSIAKAQTTAPLWANMVRSIGFVFSLVAVWYGYYVDAIVIGALIGEALALIAAMFFVRTGAKVSVSNFLVMIFAVSLVAAAIVFATNFVLLTGNIWIDSAIGTTVSIAAVGLAFCFMTQTRRWIGGKSG